MNGDCPESACRPHKCSPGPAHKNLCPATTYLLVVTDKHYVACPPTHKFLGPGPDFDHCRKDYWNRHHIGLRKDRKDHGKSCLRREGLGRRICEAKNKILPLEVAIRMARGKGYDPRCQGDDCEMFPQLLDLYFCHLLATAHRQELSNSGLMLS